MRNSKSRYEKPYTSVPEQVSILQQRGMDVGDPLQAEALLRRYGYYRLSGYTHFYRQDPSSSGFIAGTTLSQVKLLYCFDEKVRSLLLEGISQIEVALRFHIGHRLGRRDTFAHRSSAEFENKFGTWSVSENGVTLSKHQEWLKEYTRQEKRSQEAFVQHFRRHYGPHLPVWVATEVMSFGTLCQLFQAMPENDRKLVAARFGVLTRDGDGDAGTFSTWLNHLRHLRNLSAHYSRVWNRTFDVVLGKPNSSAVSELAHWDDVSVRKLYGTISVLHFLLARVNPQSDWYAEVISLVTDFSRRSGISVQAMGFPLDWQVERIWQPNYCADMHLLDVVDAIDNIAVVNRREAMGLLTQQENDAARKKWLRYLIKKDTLIGHKLGPQMYFPVFQFKDGDIFAPVATVNVNLFRRFSQTNVRPAEAALEVQRWWLTPLARHGFDSPPINWIKNNPEEVILASKRWSATHLAVR
ncbi:Abi family protein [Corynebacterium sp. A21]|uniref:Abi family protein n=1 Tax=Corynebacterium sp. A21 TaxID=3457318 RepID=UPI003FD21D9C